MKKVVAISEEAENKIIDDRADLTLALTIFCTMYSIVSQNIDSYSYGMRFCVNEGVKLIKKRYPESWKNIKELI